MITKENVLLLYQDYANAKEEYVQMYVAKCNELDDKFREYELSEYCNRFIVRYLDNSLSNLKKCISHLEEYCIESSSFDRCEIEANLYIEIIEKLLG